MKIKAQQMTFRQDITISKYHAVSAKMLPWFQRFIFIILLKCVKVSSFNVRLTELKISALYCTRVQNTNTKVAN